MYMEGRFEAGNRGMFEKGILELELSRFVFGRRLNWGVWSMEEQGGSLHNVHFRFFLCFAHIFSKKCSASYVLNSYMLAPFTRNFNLSFPTFMAYQIACSNLQFMFLASFQIIIDFKRVSQLFQFLCIARCNIVSFHAHKLCHRIELVGGGLNVLR